MARRVATSRDAEDDRLLGGVGTGSSESSSSEDRGFVNNLYSIEAQKLLFVLSALFLSVCSNWAALAYIHDYVGRIPLPDAVFSLVVEQTWAFRVGDCLVAFCTWSMVALMVVHRHRWVVVRRVCFIAACLYTMRAVSQLSTLLPAGYQNNSRECRRRLSRSNATVFLQRFVEQAVHLGFQTGNGGYLCGDLLFSGHTLSMVLSAYTVSYYTPRRLRIVGWLLHLAALVGMVCMVLCRTHYTVDVVFAYWLTAGLFVLYHCYCETSTKGHRSRSVLRTMWLFALIDWLEKNVPSGRPSNVLEWPFLSSSTWICTMVRDRLLVARRQSNESETRQNDGIVHSI